MKVLELDEHQKDRICLILSGLLASGHYTYPPNPLSPPETTGVHPRIIDPYHTILETITIYENLLQTDLRS